MEDSTDRTTERVAYRLVTLVMDGRTEDMLQAVIHGSDLSALDGLLPGVLVASSVPLPSPVIDEHGPWDKVQQRYEDGCKSDASSHRTDCGTSS